MQMTLSTYGGSSRVLKMGIFGGWSPENGNFSIGMEKEKNYYYHCLEMQ